VNTEKRHRRAAAEFLECDSRVTQEWVRSGVDGGLVAFRLMALAREFAKFEERGSKRATRAGKAG